LAEKLISVGLPPRYSRKPMVITGAVKALRSAAFQYSFDARLISTGAPGLASRSSSRRLAIWSSQKA